MVSSTPNAIAEMTTSRIRGLAPLRVRRAASTAPVRVPAASRVDSRPYPSGPLWNTLRAMIASVA